MVTNKRLRELIKQLERQVNNCNNPKKMAKTKASLQRSIEKTIDCIEEFSRQGADAAVIKMISDRAVDLGLLSLYSKLQQIS